MASSDNERSGGKLEFERLVRVRRTGDVRIMDLRDAKGEIQNRFRKCFKRRHKCIKFDESSVST